MELDDMKLAWQGINDRLQKQYDLNVQLFRDGRIDKLRRGLRPLVWGQAVQMLLGIALATWAVCFWVPHRATLHLLVSGLLVQGFGLLMIMSAGHVLALIRKLDYAAPVAEIQRRMAELRNWRVRVEAPINAIVGCFIWVPMLVMSLAWYGMDIWSTGFALWAVASSVVGLGAAVLVVWWMRHAGHERSLEQHAAGNSVCRAQMALDEIARFESEAE